MISSFESYNFYTRDKIATYNRVASDNIISREVAYYQENIRSVNTVEEFMDNDRLYNYAMKAYGLEEMTYAKGLIKQVLESNLTDSDSFANRLDDVRYKELAAAFDFGLTSTVETVQTDDQRDDLIDVYTSSIQTINTNMQTELQYFESAIAEIENVDDIFKYPRIRDFIFESFDIDPATYDYEVTRNVLTSQIDDPNSFANIEYADKTVEWIAERAPLYAEQSVLKDTIKFQFDTFGTENPLDIAELAKIEYKIDQYTRYIDKAAKYVEMASLFNFQADGTLATGTTAQTEEQLATIKEKYILEQPRLTYTAALVNVDYYTEQMGTIDNITDLIYDTRLRTFAFTAFGINTNYSDTDLRNGFYNYETDPTGDAYTSLPKEIRNFVESFNFDQNGALKAGMVAQDGTDLESTIASYKTKYDDADLAADEALIADFTKKMPRATDLDDFLSDFLDAKIVRGFALTAFGIGEDELSKRELKAILTSNLGDPNSFVNQSGDDRFRQLAKAFNFDDKGEITSPRGAQSENELTRITKAYYTELTRFDDAASTKDDTQDEIDYYRAEILKIETVDDLIGNQRLIDFLAVSERLQSEDLEPDFLKKLLMSDPNDPESLLNQQTDVRFKKIFGSFNFNDNGSVGTSTTVGVQNERGLAETENYYLTQSVEEQAGADSVGARLALYFERKAPTVSTLYEIISDVALGDFIRTALSIPSESAASDVDAQVALMERYITAEELQNPDKIEELITKFLALYDIENGLYDPTVEVFSGTNTFSSDVVAAYAEFQ